MLIYPKRILENMNVDVLRRLTRLLDLPKSLSRKDDFINALAREVETNPQGVLKRMSEGERLLLAEAAYHDGRINPDVEQIKGLAESLNIPVLTGTTPQRKRDQLYEDFRTGRIRILAVSKIANFAVDLPDASLAIQISGTFGSRQEEAQRLGRILRPKQGQNQAHFYTLVSQDTVEQDFALKRQLFLCEQGYTYSIRHVRNVEDLKGLT
jgi:superfamily II DNA or RNA helicase